MKEPKPTARTAEIVVIDREDETLVYDVRRGQAHCLNQTASFVWGNCNGQNTIRDISRLIEKRFKNSVPEDFVWLALEQLSDRGLLVDDLADLPRSPSRREMIKRVGMATVIAVPVIASIVAPSSVYASASCSCINPGACLTQTNCPSTVNCNGAGICAP